MEQKNIKLYHEQEQILYDECDHYVYQNCTTKIQLEISRKEKTDTNCRHEQNKFWIQG